MENDKWLFNLSNNYIRYVISPDENFSTIEYKVLINQKGSQLLQCSKIMCNGCPQLIYDTKQMKRFKDVLGQLPAYTYLYILSEIAATYQTVKENGFLKKEHLLLDVDYIFVSIDPVQVSAIYLPVSINENKITDLAEYTLREFLISTTSNFMDEGDKGVRAFIHDLENNVNIEVIKNKLAGGDYKDLCSVKTIQKEEQQQQHQQFKLFRRRSTEKIAKLILQSQTKLEFIINKDEFIIGKKESVVDGLIAGYPTVSRMHCKVIKRNKKYMIEDLGSANGTLVNGKKCEPNSPVTIQDRDTITISDLVFNFIEEEK